MEAICEIDAIKMYTFKKEIENLLKRSPIIDEMIKMNLNDIASLNDIIFISTLSINGTIELTINNPDNVIPYEVINIIYNTIKLFVIDNITKTKISLEDVYDFKNFISNYSFLNYSYVGSNHAFRI